MRSPTLPAWANNPPELGYHILGLRESSAYPNLSEVGRGGMGVVYKAEDTKLKRTVALKFLPLEAIGEGEQRARFEREAQAAAALNHPNVCTIHEIDQADGESFIAMEYVEGQSIRDKIESRPLKLNEALDIAVQTGQGLQAAHEEGVVHRDIKSANIMVTRRGQVKILDFGLAQLSDRTRLTETGTTLGTPAYMSPEQARGDAVDRRGDIWSLGVVAYEMITGQLPFKGEVKQAMLYSILNEEPEPLTALRSGVPIELDRVIGKALAKNPGERYQHVEELLVDLRALQKQVEEPKASREPAAKLATPAAAQAVRRSRAAWYVAAALAVAVIALVGVWFRVGPADTAPGEPLRVVPLTSYPGLEGAPSFSPDGNQVAFSWNGEQQDNYDIYVTLVDGGGLARLTTNPGEDRTPAWSPDGSTIAFFRESADGWGIYSVSPLGGYERKLSELNAQPPWRGIYGASLSWSPDGKLLAFSGRVAQDEPVRISLLSIETGEQRPLISPPLDSIGDHYGVFSPDGRSLAIVRFKEFGASDVFLVPMDGGEPTRLTSVGRTILGLAWTPDGSEIVFSVNPAGSYSLWKISASGGTPRRLAGAGDNAMYPVIAPRRRRLAYVQGTSLNVDIWRVEIDRSKQGNELPTKFIASTRTDRSPQISPDGTRVVFESDRSGSREIWVCNSNGSNTIKLTSFGVRRTTTPRWSPDGRRIAFNSNVRGSADIYTINSEGGSPQAITSGNSYDQEPSWSRDGQWIYFHSNRTGTRQVWKAPAEGGEPQQVTTRGGDQPLASPDGKFVYFPREQDHPDLWRVPVEGGEETLVLEGQRASRGCWDVRNDGLYFVDFAEGARSGNWFVKRLDLDSGEVVEIASLDREPGPANCLTVSPDGSWLLYTRQEPDEQDLMLLDNFR